MIDFVFYYYHQRRSLENIYVTKNEAETQVLKLRALHVFDMVGYFNIVYF